MHTIARNDIVHTLTTTFPVCNVHKVAVADNVFDLAQVTAEEVGMMLRSRANKAIKHCKCAESALFFCLVSRFKEGYWQSKK